MKALSRNNVHSHRPAPAGRRCCALILILSLHLGAGLNLWSQVIVVPNEYAESDGPISSTTPDGDDAGARTMHIYDASQFKALSSPAYLTQFALRPDAIPGPSGPKTGKMKIFVSTTLRSIAEITTRLDDNLGSDPTMVYDGPFNSSTANLPGPGNTRQFDVVFPFTTPFLYDPGKGNLVLEFRISEGHGPAIRFDMATASSAAIGAGAAGSATVENGQLGGAYVAQLTFEAAPHVAIRSSQVEVCWDSVSNATYRVEWRSDASGSDWTALVGCLRSTNSTTCVQDPVAPGAPRKFYRVIRTDCTP